MLNKIGLIGGGNIGGVLLQELFRRKLAKTVALMDVKGPDFAKGKCLDIAEATPISKSDVQFEAGKDYDVLEGAEIIINTAGVPRTKRPDGTIPTREELLTTNLKITDLVAGGIKKYCPDAFVVSVANPLDAIVYRLYQSLQPSKNKLMGMAGALDSSRYRYFVASAAGVSVENVEAMVLGGHGDTMVPIRSCCRIAGIPVDKFVDEETLGQLETRTRKAGGEVVGLLGVGSAFVSPALAALDMVESIVFDKKKIIPTCVLLEGEYGVNGLFVGVPVIIGKNGIEKIIELDLTEDEKAGFQRSVAAVQKTVDEIKTKG
ncbi:MAG: malate dehydrogenase [bacterium]|jgi:malate dehydrogenase|nr:malate dehydrogenase [bacterium]